MTGALRIRREVWLVRRTGDTAPCWLRWSCLVESAMDGVRVRVLEPADGNCTDLEDPAARLHDALARQVPGALWKDTRIEVGAVWTAVWAGDAPVADRRSDYALVTCADVVVTLADHLFAQPAAPWQGTRLVDGLEPNLPVVLGPSAVLSLVAGALELPGRGPGSAIPDGMSVRPEHRSPYPPHDYPVWTKSLDESDEEATALAWSATRAEHWMRPIRTTRAARGQYRVNTTLPEVGEQAAALWVESLVSLDTSGRYWHASLSVEQNGGRRWLTQPLDLAIHASDLLAAAVGQVEPARPAVDRDPVDGESFGWAPALLTTITAATLLTHDGSRSTV